MARVFECDYNDTDFPQGGSHPAGVAWDWGIDLQGPSAAGLSPAIGTLTGGGNQGIIAGEYPKITSLASRRAGYKGHRFYLADGANSGNSALGPETVSVNSRELYFRWYMRTAVQWNGEPHYWKLWRSFSAEDMDIGLGYGTSVGGHQPWGIFVGVGDNGANIEYGSNISWYTTQGNSLIGDGQWHAYEVHIVKNSNASTGDGVIEWEVDGVAAGSRSDVYFNSGTSDWGAWYVDNQNEVVNGPHTVDITDIAMDDSQRIGTIGVAAPSVSVGNFSLR